MVVLEEGSENFPSAPYECEIVGKKEKAHSREICGVWPFASSSGQIGLVTVAHDSAKIWEVEENVESGIISFEERCEVEKWRCGIQSVDVSDDGKTMVIVGTDSILYEVLISSEDEPRVVCHDLGYMELFHVKISPTLSNYITTSFSGFISEIDLNGQFSRKEPFPNVMIVSSLAYSNDGRQVAISTNEGIVHLLDVPTFKITTAFEIHATKIRAMVFSSDDKYLLTGSDDKSLKLFSLIRPGVVRVYCGNKSPITCAKFDVSTSCARFVSSSLSGQIILWHVSSPTPAFVFPKTHESVVTSLAFSPSCSHLFSVGYDKRILCHSIPDFQSSSSNGNYLAGLAEQLEENANNDVEMTEQKPTINHSMEEKPRPMEPVEEKPTPFTMNEEKPTPFQPV